MKITALFLTLLIPTFALAEVEPLSTPSPNVGTITPTAIVAETGSFSGSVTASSVTAQGNILATYGVRAATGVFTASADIGLPVRTYFPGSLLAVGVGAITSVGGSFQAAENGGTGKLLSLSHNGTDAFFQTTTQGTGGSGMKFNVYNGSAFTDAMYIAQGGSVGIGTTSPATKLHMSSGTAYIDGTSPTVWLQNDGAGYAPPKVKWKDTYGGGHWSLGLTVNASPDGSLELYDVAYGVTPLTVTKQTGRIGILTGAAGPATTLDVNGNAQFGSGATKSTFTATGDLTVGGKIGAGGVVGGAGFPLRVEGGAQFNEAGDATNFLQLQASGDDIYYDSFGTAANSGGHKFRVSDGSKIALTLDATGGASVYSRTKAQLLTIAAPIGALYYCSDCADATSGKPTVVIATGTSAGNFGTLPIGVFQ